MMKMTNLMTIHEVAKATGYTRGTLHVLSHRGEFIEPARVVGSAYLFDPKQVKAWAKSREPIRRSKPK
jgi:excisionase family DNA binding protein